LADIAAEEGELGGAQKELRAVLVTEPRYLPAHLALAEVLFKSGQPEEAAHEYDAVLAIEPNQPQAALGLARIELQRGDDEAAVARLEELVAGHPESTSGAALFAKVLERRGETDRAIALTQASQQRPEPIPADPWMSELMADLYDIPRLGLKFEEYFKTGQFDEAMPFLHRIEELDPKSSVPHLLKGWSETKAHHESEAVQQYRLALAKGGDPETVVPLLASALIALGQSTEASALLAEASAKKPDSIPLLIASADAAVRRGDEKMAKVQLTRIVNQEPYLYAENMSLVKILWSAGERAEAAECLQRIVKVFPADLASRGLLGQYYLEKSDPVSAILPLAQAIPHAGAGTPVRKQLVTMLVTAYQEAGKAEAEKGHWTAVAQYAEQAIRIDPDNLQAYADQANAAVQSGQFGHAAEALGKLAALQPDNPTIHISLGDVLYQAGEKDQAGRHWQKALQLAAVSDTELRNALNERLSGHISTETFK
jgi:tetratricopeptide (TPR) repeat protein